MHRKGTERRPRERKSTRASVPGRSMPRACSPRRWPRSSTGHTRRRRSALSTRLHDLARRADGLADGMDWKFLYDRARGVFSIGFRLAEPNTAGRLDGSYYDLLASEARLASIIAIARGEVPQEHWFR